MKKVLFNAICFILFCGIVTGCTKESVKTEMDTQKSVEVKAYKRYPGIEWMFYNHPNKKVRVSLKQQEAEELIQQLEKGKQIAKKEVVDNDIGCELNICFIQGKDKSEYQLMTLGENIIRVTKQEKKSYYVKSSELNQKMKQYAGCQDFTQDDILKCDKIQVILPQTDNQKEKAYTMTKKQQKKFNLFLKKLLNGKTTEKCGCPNNIGVKYYVGKVCYNMTFSLDSKNEANHIAGIGSKYYSLTKEMRENISGILKR